MILHGKFHLDIIQMINFCYELKKIRMNTIQGYKMHISRNKLLKGVFFFQSQGDYEWLLHSQIMYAD